MHGHLPTTDFITQYYLKKKKKLYCRLYHIFVLLKTYYSLQAEKVHELNEDIGKLLAKAEQLGAEGNVDESQKILMEVEKVRAKKKEAEVQCWLPCELSQVWAKAGCFLPLFCVPAPPFAIPAMCQQACGSVVCWIKTFLETFI